MWARVIVLGVLGMVASCYSPRTIAGAPCSPAMNCPEHQTCALVAGDYRCVEGPIDDAGPIPVDMVGVGDMAIPLDMQIDAAADAAIDAAPMPIVPWTLVQSKGSTMATTTIVASGSGHLIVVGVETDATDPVTSVTDNASNIYVAIPARAIMVSSDLGLELWYAKNSLPGATAVTSSGTTIHATVVWEVSGISTTNPLESAAKLDNQPASKIPVGARITTSVAGEFVVSAAIVANVVSGIHFGNAFTNDQQTHGNGWAHLTDRSAPVGTYQAQWDQPSMGESCASSAAFIVGP